MAHAKQDWIWYELMTPDLDAAAKFYGDVVGWHVDEVGGPQMRYLACGMGDGTRGVAGMTSLPQQSGMSVHKPGWTGYLYAEDVDAAAAAAQQAGATLQREPMDIPGTGRFAIMADPQGATFHLFKPTPPAGVQPKALEQGVLGNVGWQELGATDWEKAWNFYSGQFGWTLSEGYDMGPMGRYQCFNSSQQPGVEMTGGMMTTPPDILARTGGTAHWRFYFNVDHIRRAQQRVEAAGGKITHGPSQVPGGRWVLHATDPQGAAFYLLSQEG